MRKSSLQFIAASSAFLLLTFASVRAVADERHRFDVASQAMGKALNEFATQAGINIYFDPADVRGLTGPAVRLEGTTEEALATLLKGTALKAVRVDDNTMRVFAQGKRPQVSAAAEVGQLRLSQAMKPGSSAGSSPGSSPGAPPGAGLSAGPGASQAPAPSATLEEIVVTAQKREERLQDVPVPVTAIEASSLVRSNQLRLQDYYTMVPGLSVTPADTRGSPVLAIRGVTTGGSNNPTVGITIDDIPYGATTTFGGGFAAPDIDPGDLARVEVLRGPQGTLYGASSIGGLLKFVTVDPAMDGFSGHIEAGATDVRNGNRAGYNARGSVNVPVGDTLALRASAFTREEPGFIDNVLTGQQGVNRVDASGGRLAALWRPSEVFSIKLSAMLQDVKAYGSSEVDADLADLQQTRVRGSGGYDKKVQAYSAIVKAALGSGIDLTALSGFSINQGTDSQDFSPLLGGDLTAGQFGVTGTPTRENNRTTKFSEEVRLSQSLGESFDWLAGVFFTHERSRYSQDILAADPLVGTPVGIWSTDVIPSTYEEIAGFADLTFHVTDRFDIQLGGRESQNRQTYAETIAGPLDPILYGLDSPIVNDTVHTKDNSFTYLLTPRFRISTDLMLYARIASGYRPGGPNATSTVFGEPSSYKPDRTQNEEIGFKGYVFDRILSFDLSIYTIDWKDIQLTVVDPDNFAGFFINAARARSQGVELSLESKPLDGLTIAAWVAWNDAVLRSTLPPGPFNTAGNSGDRLPNSSRLSGSLSLDQTFPLGASLSGFVGATLSYAGDRKGVFTSPPTAPDRQTFGAYAKTDLRAGVKYQTWTVNLFATNVTDRRGVLNGGLGTLNPNAFTLTQPRTIGISLDKAF